MGWFHLVKWCKLMHAKRRGGLGIKNLKCQSKALKMKLLWRYSQEPIAYWMDIIRAKYGEDNKCTTKEVNTPYGVSLCRSIRALWPLMKGHTSIRVANGCKTSFWEDRWITNP